MTLTWSILSKVTGNACFISDILFTGPQANSHIFEAPLSRRTDHHFKLRRKFYQPKPNILLQFSGREIDGRSVAKLVHDSVADIEKDTDPGFFGRLLSKHYQVNDLKNSGFILSVMRENEIGHIGVHREQWNCDVSNQNNFELFYGGSGKIFAEGLDLHETFNENYHQEGTSDVLKPALDLVLKSFRHEMFSPEEFPFFGYGGWIELFEYRRSGFVPISFAINILRKLPEDRISFEGRVISHYVDGGLVIANISGEGIRNPKDSPPTIWLVRDLFGEKQSQPTKFIGPQIVIGSPDYIMNIVIQDDIAIMSTSNDDIISYEKSTGFFLDRNKILEILEDD